MSFKKIIEIIGSELKALELMETIKLNSIRYLSEQTGGNINDNSKSKFIEHNFQNLPRNKKNSNCTKFIKINEFGC